jgi:acetolactate synthase-1/2/3 large subunit
MEQVIGGRLAAEALVEQGVEYVFTLSGGHITPIYQFLEGSPVVIFDTRHEQAAVFMAEAWARMTRKPAVAMVTAGPGFTNALSGIANARLSNAPVVLIAGCVGLESAEKLDLQDMNQLPVIAPMVKKAWVCHMPERIPEFIDLAFRTAAAGRPGPVYLELPCDVLNKTVDPARVRRPMSHVESRPMDPEGAREILMMLQAATSPVIIAGSGAWYADAGEALRGFVERTGVPVFTGNSGRGVISDTHPLCFQSSLAIRPGAAFLALASADLVLFLGSRLSLFFLFGDIFRKDARFIQADIEAEEIGRSRFQGWVETVRKADLEGKAPTEPLWTSDAIPIHPLRLAREVDAFMDRDDDIVVADGGDTQVWMGMTRTVRGGGRYLDSGLYGCLAVGLPFANAAKLRHPESRVLLISGDGSIGFNFMEFHTAIRKGLPIVVVIANDQSWGMIAHSQTLRLGHSISDGTWLGRVDYHRLVEVLGGFSALVERPEEIRPALKAAFASGRTACINVMVDPSVISPGSVALANLGGYCAK